MTDPWHVVVTRPAQEARAKKHLESQRIRTLCPQYRTARDTIRPMFPGYLFVSFSPDFAWGVICNTYGVSRMLLVNGIPGTVPASVMDEFLAMEGCPVLDERKIAPAFVPGDSVRLGDGAGALTGLVGQFIRMRPHQRCEVLLAMLGGVRPLIIPVAQLEREHERAS